MSHVDSNATTDIVANHGHGGALASSISNYDDYAYDNATGDDAISTQSTRTTSLTARPLVRRLIIGAVIVCVVYLLCFVFIGGMLKASGGDGGDDDDADTSVSSSSILIRDDDDDGGGANTNTNNLVATKGPTGLRSTSAPSPSPIQATDAPTEVPNGQPTGSLMSQPTKAPTTNNQPTKPPTDEPTDAPTNNKPTNNPTTTDQPSKAPIKSPTNSPSLRPTQLFTMSKQSVVVEESVVEESSTSATEKQFSLNVQSWMDAFNELTLNEEETTTATTTTSSTGAFSETSSTTTTSTRNFTNWIAAFEALALDTMYKPPKTTTTTTTTTTTPLDMTLYENTCLTAEECDVQRQKMGFQYFLAGTYPLKGCFHKSDVAYFGEGGTVQEMSSDSVGQKIRIWCGEYQVDTIGNGINKLQVDNTDNLPVATPNPTKNPTSMPSNTPTTKPTPKPTDMTSNLPVVTTPDPTKKPTLMPSSTPTTKPTPKPTDITDDLAVATATPDPTKKPTLMPSSTPTSKPTPKPTAEPTHAPTMRPPDNCFTISTYESIDNDINVLKNNIGNAQERSHFVGGIVRLVAHDFMDFDRNDALNPMGPDGCFNTTHPANAGLSQGIWCQNCPLTMLYEAKYSHLSRADYWIASANAVIRQTSVNNTLDLRDTFSWGRVDADSCPGQGDRLPSPRSCGDVEHVFLMKMGLSWKDAVALMGAHTLGRGERDFSGHQGRWAKTDEDAQVFDKEYFEEIYLNSWRPRNSGQPNQDWTTGRDNGSTRVMLNTDMCLVYDIDDIATSTCCSRTGWSYADGTDHCIDNNAAARRCPHLSSSHSRWEATEAIGEMLGGSYPNTNNQPFYDAFAEAWRKATTIGQDSLSPLGESCELVR